MTENLWLAMATYLLFFYAKLAAQVQRMVEKYLPNVVTQELQTRGRSFLLEFLRQPHAVDILGYLVLLLLP